MPLNIDDLLARPNFKPKDWQATAPLKNPWGGIAKNKVRKSPDLARIAKLPRRVQECTPEQIEFVTQRYRKSGLSRCLCSEIRPRKDGKPSCITGFRKIQATMLLELSRVGGLLGGVGVGHGKTIAGICAPLAIRDCKLALLLCPPGLIDQLITEYELLDQHYVTPSLVTYGRVPYENTNPGMPVLHVFPYSKLSRENAAIFLEELSPDFIIADECHKLRNRDSTRTRRLLRYFENHPNTRFAGWTGSLTDSSIKDYAHLAALALKLGSPLPIDPDVVDEWSKALDPGDSPAPAGALFELCEPGEHVLDGFRRRLVQTPGIVMTSESAVSVDLIIGERKAPEIPTAVQDALNALRADWIRPDGEELVTPLDLARVACELASGFYYVWTFPNGEPEHLIRRWLEARKFWHREMRQQLKHGHEYLDSPLLLEKAARRAHGFTEITAKNRHLPHWKSYTYPEWRQVKGLVKPVTKPIRLHDYLARDAAQWANANRGIVWYAQRCFGEWVAELSGLPLHGGGPKAAERIREVTGDTSIIASIQSHGTGRDGLQFLFQHQLVANPPTSTSQWEQLLGRLHRTGQSSTVHAEFYCHTTELKSHVKTAIERAEYVEKTLGAKQKLINSLPK